MSSNEQKSSYESLDDYNYALETLKISDNYCEKNKILKFYDNQSINQTGEIQICSTVPGNAIKQKIHQLSQHHLNKLTPLDTAAEEENNIKQIAEDSKKQKQLSDWYYIKTSPKPKQPSSYERNRTRNYPHNHHQHSDNPIKTVRDNNLNSPPPLHNGNNDKDMSNDDKILSTPPLAPPASLTILNIKYSPPPPLPPTTAQEMGKTTKIIENFNEKFKNISTDNQILLTKRLNEKHMKKLSSPIFNIRREKYHQFDENEIENKLQQSAAGVVGEEPQQQQYRSNDFIYHYRQQQQQYEQQQQQMHQQNFADVTTQPPQYITSTVVQPEKSPVPTNKCFNINLRNRNHTSHHKNNKNHVRNNNFEQNNQITKSQSTSNANAAMYFADVTSSSFEHVNNIADDMVTTGNFYPNHSEKVINSSTNYINKTFATTTTGATPMKMYSKEYENLKDAREMDSKYRAAMTRPLPQLPQLPSELNKVSAFFQFYF
jgi:hypothetical protein